MKPSTTCMLSSLAEPSAFLNHHSSPIQQQDQSPSGCTLCSPISSLPFLPCASPCHLSHHPISMVDLDIANTLPTSLHRTPDSGPSSPPQPYSIKSRSNLPAWTPPCLPRPHSPTPKQNIRYARKPGLDKVVYTKPKTAETSTETGSSIQLSRVCLPEGSSSSCGRCNGHQCSLPFGTWSPYQKGVWVQNGAVDAYRWGSVPWRGYGQSCEWSHLPDDHVPGRGSRQNHCSHSHIFSESGKSSRADSPAVASLHIQHHKCRRPH